MSYKKSSREKILTQYLKMSKKYTCIETAIKKGGEISPFLFVGANTELLGSELSAYLQWLLTEYQIDQQSLFCLSSGESQIKIGEIKFFISQSQVRPRFAFQIFLIEDISRMTNQAQNACLKFFEEPGVGNIVVLTSQSTSNILDTVLSRLQIHNIWGESTYRAGEFYREMIRSYCENGSDELIRYLFPAKLEKQEYISFLLSLIEYISHSGKHMNLLDDIHEDIWGILKNNLNPRYVADRYVLAIWK